MSLREDVSECLSSNRGLVKTLEAIVKLIEQREQAERDRIKEIIKRNYLYDAASIIELIYPTVKKLPAGWYAYRHNFKPPEKVHFHYFAYEFEPQVDTEYLPVINPFQQKAPQESKAGTHVQSVMESRKNGSGCCERYNDHMGCDCLEIARRDDSTSKSNDLVDNDSWSK